MRLNSFVKPSSRCVPLAASLVFCLIGCGQGEPIRVYSIPQETQTIVTSDALRGQFGVIPFDWDSPKNWVSAENDQFSKVAWTIGDKGNAGRITVTDLPASAGLVPQVTRWRGQLKMKNGTNPMADTEQFDLGGLKATWADLQGEDEAILAMMVSHENKLWIFKFRGSNSVADANRKQFRDFCESVEISG